MDYTVPILAQGKDNNKHNNNNNHHHKLRKAVMYPYLMR